jgi:integrase
MVRNRQPVGLTDSEVHAVLRAAGASGHGLATRNYALVQVMLQTGIRVDELAMLRVGDVTVNDRSGMAGSSTASPTAAGLVQTTS